MVSMASRIFIFLGGLGLGFTCISRRSVRLSLVVLGDVVLLVFFYQQMIALWVPRVDFPYL